MAGYKETPRQKMIAMMYLVLTALLALNVSVEILNAFLVVNESMETTNRNYASKTRDMYNRFEKAYQQMPEKVGPYWKQAQFARKISDSLRNYINEIKYGVIAKSERISVKEAQDLPLRLTKTKDRYDDATVYLIGNSQDGSAGKSRQLKEAIIKYKHDMLNLVEAKYKNQIKLGLDTDGPFYDAGGVKQNWEMHNFYHTILAADVTILNKLISEVSNAETDVVSHLQTAVSADDYKFDQVGAQIVPKSQYVFLGDNFEADVFVTAIDTKQNFSISGRQSVDGVAKITIPASSEGTKTFSGSVTMMDPSGNLKNYPVKMDYIVAPPTLSVSATKMNVFYMGVDNPVSISAGGVSDAQINASINNGSISRNGRAWNVRVTQPGPAVINVSASIGGRAKSLGSVTYKAKQLPDPTAFVANSTGGIITLSQIMAGGAVIPRPPADFEFDANFIITKYTFSGVRRGDIKEIQASNNRITSDMTSFIAGCKRGDKIWFENIFATGPDGKTRKINSIVFTIQ